MSTRRFWYVSDRHRRGLFMPPLTSPSSGFHRIIARGKQPHTKGFNKNRICSADDYDDDDDDELLMKMIHDDEIDNDIRSLDDVIHRLRRNELTILRLGFTESDYFSHLGSNESVRQHNRHHHSSKDMISGYYGPLVTLERALRVNRSVRSICLGWRLSPHLLFHILTAITYHGIPLYQLRHIKIVVLGSEMSSDRSLLPDSILTDLFHRQQKLRSIDLRSVQVSKTLVQEQRSAQLSQVDASRTITSNEANYKQSKATHAQKSHPGSVITHCILQQYQKLSRLKSLSLIDCGVTGDIAIDLAQFIHIRGGIAELSLRSNRKLSITSKVGQSGIRMICQAPIMRKLDLSLCDLDGTDIVHAANGIAARTYPIGEVKLSGNYRMDNSGLNAMLQPLCCQKMLILNVSHCSITSDRLVNILNTLAQLKAYNTLLRRVVLCGAKVSNDAATIALHNLLLSDCPIRSIDLHDAQEPKPLTWEQMQRIANAISTNYEMEELIFHHRCREYVDCQLRNDLEFYFQLNQVGRRILRAPLHPTIPIILSSQVLLHRHLSPSMRSLITCNASTTNDWYQVLEKAGAADNLDTLYWIIRHGGVYLFS